MKTKKLCDWNKLDIKENKSLFVSLVKNPDIYCKKCARVTNDANYICKSEKLSNLK
jgi:hypothetical protein